MTNSEARKRMAARNAAPDTTGLREAEVHGRGPGWATACGQDRANVRAWTDDAARVTCRACLPAMPNATVSDPAALTDAEREALFMRTRILETNVQRIAAARVAEAVEQERTHSSCGKTFRAEHKQRMFAENAALQERAARLALIAKIEAALNEASTSANEFGSRTFTLTLDDDLRALLTADN